MALSTVCVVVYRKVQFLERPLNLSSAAYTVPMTPCSIHQNFHELTIVVLIKHRVTRIYSGVRSTVR